MTSDPQHANHAAGASGAAQPSALDQMQLLRLEMLELQTDLDAKNIAQLREQNKQLEDALKKEQERDERHADALMQIARTCDSFKRCCENKADHLRAQLASTLFANENTVAKLENEKAALRAATSATIAKLEQEKAALEAQVAVFQAQAMSKLTDIHAAVTAPRTLEIHPVRPDRRQFAGWHTGPVPACVTFDHDWCTMACSTWWKVDIDAAGMRAHVIKSIQGCLTLRSAAPLARRPWLPFMAGDGPQRGELPSYRIVIEAYGESGHCALGFVPSHGCAFMQSGARGLAAISPFPGCDISNYGGWFIDVHEGSPTIVPDGTRSGWTALVPSRGSDAGGAVCNDTSTYATTSTVPPLPAGSAVEFTVDYAAGTCLVAFYTPAAVARGFRAAPHAVLELRFVVTEAERNIPARSSIPTTPDSVLALYPAVATTFDDAIFRFGA
jgi:hypothetical protein